MGSLDNFNTYSSSCTSFSRACAKKSFAVPLPMFLMLYVLPAMSLVSMDLSRNANEMSGHAPRHVTRGKINMVRATRGMHVECRTACGAVR